MGRLNNIVWKTGLLVVFCLVLSACGGMWSPNQPLPSAPPEAVPSEQAATTAPVLSPSPGIPPVTPSNTPRADTAVTSPTAASPSDTPAPTPTPQPSSTAAPAVTPTSSASPTPTRTSTPLPTVVLGALGPWLVYYDAPASALAAANPDGSGRMVLFQPVGVPISMDGSALNMLAVTVRWPAFADSYPADEGLIVFELPSGQIRSIIPLAAHPGAPSRLDYSGSQAWSADGRYLAYTAALHDETPDLYVYEAVSRLSTRLTSRPNRAAFPFWSPDGRWIIHTEMTYDAVPCPGIAIWAAALDGSGSRELVRESCPTGLVGWYAADRFVLFAHQNNIVENIWAINLTTGETMDLLPPNFDSSPGTRPQLNPGTGDVIFEGCYRTGLCGTFSASAANPTPLRLAAAFTQSEFMSSLDRFIGSPGTTCYLLLFSAGFPARCIFENLIPGDPGLRFSVSPDGSRLFVPANDGYYLSTAALQPVRISTASQPLGSCSLVNWTADGRSFLLRCDAGLFIGQTATAQAVLAPGTAGLQLALAAWRPDGNGVFVLANEGLYYLDAARLELMFLSTAAKDVGVTWVGR
jgi:hypothetical protein